MTSKTTSQSSHLTDKLSILFIPRETYPTFRVDVCELFGEQFSRRGHKIDWIFRSESDCDKDYVTTWEGNRVWVGKTDNGGSAIARLRKHFYSIVNDFRLFSLARKNKYDFIQVKDKFIAAVFGLIASRLNKVPFYLWISFPLPEHSIYAWKQKTARYPLFYLLRGYVQKWLLYKMICPFSNHIFVQSEQMKRDFMAEGVDEQKMTAVPMGYTLKAQVEHKSNNLLKKEDSDKIVLYLGALDSERKIDFVIRSFEFVLQQYASVKLYIVGDSHDSNDRQNLEHLAKQLGLEDSVIFTGFLPREEALGYIEKADVCVSPYFPTPVLNSTSPTKIIEYMSYGKAVVANDHPEQRDIIRLSGGGYCVPYKEFDFAEAIVKLLQDEELSIQMGKAGRVWVENNRTYTILADQLEKKYYQLLAK